MATWTTLVALLSTHLATNYAAVRAVSMRCLNRQRANIVLAGILQHGEVLLPTDVSKRERIFERDGVLRWADDQIVGHCSIGVTLNTVLCRMGHRHIQTGALDLEAVKLSELLHVYEHEGYILWFDQSQSEGMIVLKQGCTPMDQLKAWAHALMMAQDVRARKEKNGLQQLENEGSTRSKEVVVELRHALQETRVLFAAFTDRLRDAGWDLDLAALETRAGSRAVMKSD
jgi:hypothetical protein